MLGTSEATLYDHLGCNNRAQVVRIQGLGGGVPQVELGEGGVTLPPTCSNDGLNWDIPLEEE